MIKPLTSLRFFFALFVFFSHLPFLGLHTPFLKYLQGKVLSEGYLGVSFFFILSGFILSYSYKLRILSKEVNKKSFIIARIARIYPLHLFTLALAIPLAIPELFRNFFIWGGKFFFNAFLLQSFIPIQSVFFSFNAPAWSISDEMFFYLLFPLLVPLLFNYRKAVVMAISLVCLIPILVFIVDKAYYHSLFYINPFFRVADFLVGILLYEVYEKGWFKVNKRATCLELGSVIIFSCFLYLHFNISQVFRYSSYYWLPMSILIYVFAFQKGVISRILSNRIFVLLGEISFGFYLFHYLVMEYISVYFPWIKASLNDYVLILFVFIFTLVVSYLSFFYIEKPCNRFIKASLNNHNLLPLRLSMPIFSSLKNRKHKKV